MRKDFLSKVVVKVRTMITDTFQVEISTKETETLLAMACALGYVTGKRGRDGGYFVTNEGLEFIGENVATFQASETQTAAQKQEQLKQARKEANKARKAVLQEQIAQAAQVA